jgi:hypothetical protein
LSIAALLIIKGLPPLIGMNSEYFSSFEKKHGIGVAGEAVGPHLK